MEQPHPSDAPAQPRTQDAPAAHPVVHPGERPVRALIAARLSKLQRGGQQGIGIDTQDEKSRAFCEREGMTVVGVVADTKSGTVAPWDRKNLKPWVTEPEKMAMYDAVVAYKTDRWSRGTQEDFTRIEFWATQHGKRLIIVDGPQYPARADRFDSDYWQWQAEKMAARREWELGRERVVRATDALRRENKFVGRIPWGYVTEGPKYDRRLAATDLGREYIPQIYDRVIAGHSLADICGWLDSLHLWHKRDPQTGELADVPWWPTRLADLIRSPVYRGHYWMTRAERDPVTGKVVWSEKWEHSCEALIDARRFRLANEALAGPGEARPEGGAADAGDAEGRHQVPGLRGLVDEQAHLPGVEQARRRDLHLLPVHRHREPPQGVRQHGADGSGGRGRQRDHGHHVPRPGQAAHPGQGHRLPGPAG